ncbi:MAG: nitroreductase [Ilumatobacter sp.]|jgi:nitroreductase
MDIDVGAVDHALTTTRAVRRRLDLERTVDNQIILDCIDVAEQAPTGGNLSSRRWLVIREPRLKQALADLYMAGAGQWMANAADRLKGTGDPQEKNMASAKHLAENLANVPAIVIPTIIGRHDGSGRPGLFDSVIQSGWSFCVALRARGLGTAWVTAALADQEKVKELLGIPEHMTEIAMFPVAWTKGTDFSPAPRPPARTVTFFDGWAQTFESGPSNPVRLVDGPGTVAEVDINAPAAAIWPFLTDIGLSSRFSNEFQGAEWVAGTLVGGQPIVGSSFVGTNENPSLGEFKVPSFIDTYEQDVAFGWRTSSVENPGARWRFEIEPNGSGSRLRYTAALGPGPSGLTIAIESMPDKEHRIIYRRIEGLYANMRKVVVGIKKLAEATQL